MDLEISVVESIDGVLRQELLDFMTSLGDELSGVGTEMEEILQSELLMTARVKGRVVGLSGIARKIVHLPFWFGIISREFQGRGVVDEFYRAMLPYMKSYFCIYGIVGRDNVRCLKFLNRVDDRPIYEDVQYAYVVFSQHRRSSRVWMRVLRTVLPPAVALWRFLAKYKKDTKSQKHNQDQ